MRRQVMLLWLLVACGSGLFRLGTMYIFRSYVIVLLCGLALIAFGLLRVAGQRRVQAGSPRPRGAGAGALAAAIVGWLLAPALASLLLLAPFPQRWGLVGSWTTTVQMDRPMHVEHEFSLWGTTTTYRDGELRATGRYVFLDNQTIEVESRALPRLLTQGPQYTVYRLQVKGDTLVLTLLLTNRATTYQRSQP